MARTGVAPDRSARIRERAIRIEKPAPSTPSLAAAALRSAASYARPLVISGMHRSGTSLVASLLQEVGLEIGDRLMGPGPGNERGHFEDHDFYRLHEEMLQAIGSTALMGVEELILPASGDFAARARALIQRREALDLWGWKDPRTCIFLDFWERLLPRANYLFLYRHPLDVALSLRRRFTDPEVHLDPWAGLRAWGVYNRYLLRFVERHPGRCFLAQVPALTVDLHAFVRRVAAKLALPLDQSRITSVFAPSELATEFADGKLSSAWQELIPESLALYRRLETAADLPSREFTKSVQREDSTTLASLFRDLRSSQMERERPAERIAAESAGAVRGPEMDSRWTVVDRRSLGNVLAEAGERRKTVAALEADVKAAASRCEELATTLQAIERSRAFRIASATWRLAGWWRGRR